MPKRSGSINLRQINRVKFARTKAFPLVWNPSRGLIESIRSQAEISGPIRNGWMPWNKPEKFCVLMAFMSLQPITRAM
ncbi:hypothetical protein D3C74_393070 [compost metagenome]